MGLKVAYMALWRSFPDVAPDVKTELFPGPFADGETRTRTGETTLSVVGRDLSCCRETPAITRLRRACPSEPVVRKLRPFVVSLGTERDLGAQTMAPRAGMAEHRSRADLDRRQRRGPVSNRLLHEHA